MWFSMWKVDDQSSFRCKGLNENGRFQWVSRQSDSEINRGMQQTTPRVHPREIYFGDKDVAIKKYGPYNLTAFNGSKRTVEKQRNPHEGPLENHTSPATSLSTLVIFCFAQLPMELQLPWLPSTIMSFRVSQWHASLFLSSDFLYRIQMLNN